MGAVVVRDNYPDNTGAQLNSGFENTTGIDGSFPDASLKMGSNQAQELSGSFPDFSNSFRDGTGVVVDQVSLASVLGNKGYLVDVYGVVGKENRVVVSREEGSDGPGFTLRMIYDGSISEAMFFDSKPEVYMQETGHSFSVVHQDCGETAYFVNDNGTFTARPVHRADETGSLNEAVGDSRESRVTLRD